MQLAEEVARLADIAERMFERTERGDRDTRSEHLLLRWGTGRDGPWRLTLGALLEAVPGLAAHFEKTVPDEFIAQVDDGLLEVACPCGETPAVGPGRLAGCGCGRWFLHDGHDVHVAKLEPNTQLETSAAE